MAIQRNIKATNPNRRPMSVDDMKLPIQLENDRILSRLEMLEKERKKSFINFVTGCYKRRFRALRKDEK